MYFPSLSCSACDFGIFDTSLFPHPSYSLLKTHYFLNVYVFTCLLQVQFEDLNSTPAKVRFSHSQKAGSVQFAALGEVGLADSSAEQKLQHMFRLGPGTQVSSLHIRGHPRSSALYRFRILCCTRCLQSRKFQGMCRVWWGWHARAAFTCLVRIEYISKHPMCRNNFVATHVILLSYTTNGTCTCVSVFGNFCCVTTPGRLKYCNSC